MAGLTMTMSAPSATSCRDFGNGLAFPLHPRVLLVAATVSPAGNGDIDRLAEGAIQRGGILRGVGQDGNAVETAFLETTARDEQPPARPSCR